MRKLTQDHPNQGFLFNTDGQPLPSSAMELGSHKADDFQKVTAPKTDTTTENIFDIELELRNAPEDSYSAKQKYADSIVSNLIISQSLAAFRQKYHAPIRICDANAPLGLNYSREQVRCAELLNSTAGNFMIEAPTGSGKTAIASLFIAAQLKPDAKIIIVAPTRILCAQWEDRLKNFISFEDLNFECSVTSLSGKGVVPANKRIKALTSPGAEVILVTPESLERDLKKIPVDEFSRKYPLVIFDEGDEARKNDAMNVVYQEIKWRGSRQVLFSAAFEDKLQEVVKMAHDKQAIYYPVKIPPQLYTRVNRVVSLNEFVDPEKKETLTSAKEILLSAQREYAEKIVAALNKIKTEHPLGKRIDKLLKDAESRDSWIAYQKWTKTITEIRGAFNVDDDTRLTDKGAAKALSAAYAINHIAHLYKALMVGGSSSYLHFVACNIAATRFLVPNLGGGATGVSTAKYRDQLYRPALLRESPVLRAFVSLANGGIKVDEQGKLVKSPDALNFLKWAGAPSLTEIARMHYQGDELTKIEAFLSTAKTRKQTAQHLLELAHKDLSDRGTQWANHPKEELLLKDLREYFRVRGSEGKALIYTYYAEHAFHLKRLLNSMSEETGIRAAAITGSQHQLIGDRDEELTAYRSGQANVLIFTDVAKKGIDTPAENLFIYNPPSNGRDLLQLIGRIRNHKNHHPKYTNPQTGESISLAKVWVYRVGAGSEQWGLLAADNGLKQIKSRSQERDEPDADTEGVWIF